MQKITLYISSRSNTKSVGLEKTIKLSDLRTKLRDALEKETFLGEDIIEIIIHENNFDADGSQDAYQVSLTKMDKCNIVVILYNGDSGWNAASTGNGICHDEYLKAVDEFSQMMHVINVSEVFPKSKSLAGENEKDLNFQAAVTKNGFSWAENITALTVDELYKKTISQIKSLIISDLEKAFKTQKYHVKKSTVYGATLQFAQLTYAERADRIMQKLKEKAPVLFPEIILNMDAVPDNMSVSNARAYIGRPFLDELSIIKGKKEEIGVIHIIAVYGTVTELQVKNLVGFPDLAVNKTTFGFYLWDTTNHIQMFFLQKCINTDAVGQHVNYLEQWLKTSGERANIMNRAKARFSILTAINLSKQLLTI